MTDIYKAPTANLNKEPVPETGSGSIANGVAGNYDISIGAILSEAWAKTKGAKGTAWLGILFYAIVLGVVATVINLVLNMLGLGPVSDDPHASKIAPMLISQLVQNLIGLPMAAGLMMIGIKQAVRVPAEGSEVFRYFHKTLSVFATVLLMYVAVVIGFVLLVIPGIYLMIAYGLALPLVVEKNLSPWQALETSRKAITHRWFKVFGLYLVLFVIVVIASIPLAIGLIWVLPMMLLVMGILYRTIFGYETDRTQANTSGTV